MTGPNSAMVAVSPPPVLRRRGAPLGNRNAVTHGRRTAEAGRDRAAARARITGRVTKLAEGFPPKQCRGGIPPLVIFCEQTEQFHCGFRAAGATQEAWRAERQRQCPETWPALRGNDAASPRNTARHCAHALSHQTRLGVCPLACDREEGGQACGAARLERAASFQRRIGDARGGCRASRQKCANLGPVT